MSNKFDDFLEDNKAEFDSHEPSEALWQRIENKLGDPKKKGMLVNMGMRKWMSAAAAVVVIAGAAFFFTRKDKIETPPVAKIYGLKIPVADSNEKNTLIAETNTTIDAPDSNSSLTEIKTADPVLAENDALQSIASQELVHYTKLIELKQQQITILKKDEPLLYKQFASDFARIDDEFTQLKKQKNNHPNNEQLLEAMLENLRMQSALLSRQLEIVKNINNNKKKRYEKTYNNSI